MSRRFADGRYLSTTQQGYGYRHQQRRQVWAVKVERGEVACRHCHRQILPGTPWDLAHPADIKQAEPHPWHATCNRSYAMKVTRRRLNGREPLTRPSSRRPADDWFLYAPPMKWCRVWASPPPQGYYLTTDPTGTVIYPDGDPRNDNKENNP